MFGHARLYLTMLGCVWGKLWMQKMGSFFVLKMNMICSRPRACMPICVDACAPGRLTRPRIIFKSSVASRAAKASGRGKITDGANMVHELKNTGSILTYIFGLTFERAELTNSSAHQMRLCLVKSCAAHATHSCDAVAPRCLARASDSLARGSPSGGET